MKTFALLKQILFILILVFSVGSFAYAQSPQKVNYQAIARDVSGNPLTSEAITVIFEIRHNSAGGTLVYSETHTATTNNYGLFTLAIGTGTTSYDFSSIDWSAGSYFLKTNLNGNEMGTTQLISVPYSLYANKAGIAETENDPLFIVSPAASIISGDLTNWNTAYGWGNHGIAGYLTVESDPDFASSTASGITITDFNNWNTAYGWGNHAAANYDPSNTNEIQALSLVGDELRLTSSAPVNLSAFKDSKWAMNSDSLYYTGGNVGIGTQTPTSTLSIEGSTALDEAIFEVKNNNGQTVFAVYEDGVDIYIDETAKKGAGARGGFSVAGFDPANKGLTNYMNITGDSIRMYIDNVSDSKGVKGGFAVGGFDKSPSKADPTTNFMAITGEESGTEGYNTFLGYQAGGNGGGENNTAIGYFAGYTIGNGSYNNVFIGDSAGYSANGGYNNVIIGTGAGAYTAGYHNVLIGYNAGGDGWNQYNTMVGNEAGRDNDGGFSNVFLGDNAGRGVVDGYRNTLIGTWAGRVINNGNNNVFIGNGAGQTSADGNNNTYIGESAGASNSDGSNNLFIGQMSGMNTSGSSNIILGNTTGPSTGSYNLILGHGVASGVEAMNYQIAIDYMGRVNQEDLFINGNMQSRMLRFNSRVGINTAPEVGYDLVVPGYIKAESYQSSDLRLKTDIVTILNPLQKVLNLRGVTYKWKDSFKKDNSKHIGFIAQEAIDIIPEVVNTSGNYMAINYAPVTALLVEAVKELKRENDELKARLNRIDELEAALEEMKKLIEEK